MNNIEKTGRITRRVFAAIGTAAVLDQFYPGAVSADEAVNIAVIGPLSGSNSVGGEMVARASKLAVQDINTAGGIHALNGAKINLIIADSSSTTQGAITTTERVLDQHKVTAVFGLVISPLTAAAIPALIKHQVPAITASTANSLVTPANDGFLFMIGPTGDELGRVAVDFVNHLNGQRRLNIKRVAILYINDPYGQSAQKGVERIVRDAGMDVVLKSAYPADLTDASPLVAKVEQSGAQALFPLSDVTDASLILTALRAARSKVLVFGSGSGFTWPPIGQSLGPKVDGLFGGAAWNWDMKNVVAHPALVDVAERYERAYGTYMPEQAGEAYAALWCFAYAMERCKSADSRKVRDTLATMKFDTGFARMMQPGFVRFGSNGYNADAKAVMVQWQGGKPRTVFPPELTSRSVLGQ